MTEDELTLQEIALLRAELDITRVVLQAIRENNLHADDVITPFGVPSDILGLDD